jgi:microcystin degradation protein MlrC
LNKAEFQSEDGPELIYASIPGPELIKKALDAGVGGTVAAKVGAAVDDRYAPPVLLKGKVLAIKEGDRNARTEVVVQSGSLKVIVTEKRKPYHYLKDFTDLDLNPEQADILMVKIGYLVPELYEIRADWVMALTPGGVDQDLYRLPYQYIQRPMFPLDTFEEEPDLSTRFLEAYSK